MYRVIMKKIAITTLLNSVNYGGILQAVALNQVLKDRYGNQPVFITHQKIQSSWNSSVDYVKRRVGLYGCHDGKTFLRILGGIGKTLLSNIHYFEREKKRKTFVNFITRYLVETPYYGTFEKVKEYCQDYDIYITGSDQVWNSAFNYNEFDPVYLLEFVPNNKEKYSYAASVGGEKTEEYIHELVDRTKDFRGISVREKSLEIKMNQLGANNVLTVLDPTLLLNLDEWSKFERVPKRSIPERYIAVYFLEKDADNDPTIKEVYQKLGLPIINLLPMHKKAAYPCYKDFTAGPAEFLYYIHHADYIITNSFHAVVFSIIFRRKFIALQRVGQESREKDLLEQLNLSEHLIEGLSDISIIEEPIADCIEEILDQSRNWAFEFLDAINRQKID